MKRLLICLLLLCVAGGRTKEIVSRNPGIGRVVAITFDEGAGAKDWSNRGNDGTPDGATFGFDATQGAAYSFDGSNDNIGVGSDASIDDLAPISISAWASFTDDGSHSDIVSKYNGATAGWTFRFAWAIPNTNDDTIAFLQDFTGDDGIWHIPKQSIGFGQWYHVAVVYNNSSSNNVPVMYLNGVSQAITEFRAPIGTRDSDASLNMQIGEGDDNLLGSVDDVLVYNRALSATEVMQLYQEGLAKRP